MNVVIVGLGNIGGSFAKSIRHSFKDYNIYAIDINVDTLREAEKLDIINKGYTDFKEIIPEADLVIFSVYPMTLKNMVESYAPYFKPNAILTDVTGVKESIIAEIEPLLHSKIDFVFGHPMAGRESRGLGFSSRDIFQNANYIITPTKKNKHENIMFLENFVKKLGFGNVSKVTPEFHDEVIGFTSQLAHVIAVSLINSDDIERNSKRYTGDSYRDLTRITNINEKLWPELFLMNKNHLLRHITLFKDEIERMEDAIRTNDIQKMERMMVESKRRYHDLHDLEYNPED
ncbi:prephenate dehydrogenase [Phocicoccus pinnipedialis]|uniref:Prephenate dehydrogenase n=1 Tax=Phocicoccus pinnipedialis TaxID=110845 RepID=A0A6V7R6B1_9BACL|nr:prephenate dehydrogenase [Jeotgalicoccus pinnipedialis]MBP1939794.1 prephenate dehydrogenase [Jeotgalicoccus pinnipedialis]CAD2072422.1 prephenate dehydrogenase [Jeotgalicoccus pinnipedialis]